MIKIILPIFCQKIAANLHWSNSTFLLMSFTELFLEKFTEPLLCASPSMYLVSLHLLLFSHSVVSNPLWPHGLQHARIPCPSPSPRAFSNSCPLSWWRNPTISSTVVPFFSCLRFFPASESFLCVSFHIGDQSIGVSSSASLLPMNIQDLFPVGWTGWISLQSKWLSRVFSNTTAQKHQFFGVQPSLWSNPSIHTWWLEKP